MEQILEAFKTISDKISTYQIFTFFYPGAVFLGLLSWTYDGEKPELSIWEGVFLCYTVGMIISRIGTFIEDFLFLIRIMNRIDYKKIITAEAIDAKVNMLLRISNMYRTMAAVFFSLIGFMAINVCHPLGFTFPKGMTCFSILMIILFVYSFSKQYGYARERVEHVCTNNNILHNQQADNGNNS